MTEFPTLRPHFSSQPIWQRLLAFGHNYMHAVLRHEIGVRAAALAYYALFSLFPLVLLIISGIGFVLRSDTLQQQIMAQINHVLPTRGDVVGTVIDQVITARGATGFLGMLTLLWAASGFFGALEASVNTIFGSENKRSWWRRRGVGVLMVLFMAPIFSLATLLTSLSRIVTRMPFLPPAVLQLMATGIDQLVTLALIVLVFSALLHWIPRQQPGWGATLVGAVSTAIVWMALTSAFTWYLGSGLAGYNLVYGPISTVIALVLWFFLSSYVILLGATLTAQWENRERWEA